MAHACCFTLCYCDHSPSGSAGATGEELAEMRMLVALEDDYRAYRELIAAGIQVLRPQVEVTTSGLDALEEEIARLDPHVVVCSLPATMGPGDRVAWVELSIDPTQPTVICVSGRYWEVRNPVFEVMLGVVDEVEQLVDEEKSSIRVC
jgi:hypothetical protein